MDPQVDVVFNIAAMVLWVYLSPFNFQISSFTHHLLKALTRSQSACTSVAN